MAKPIRLTEEWIRSMAEEFMEKLRKANIADGKVSYTKSFQWKDDDHKVNVLFAPDAYAKMLTLLHGFKSEVAWHGIVERRSDDCFVIKDIVVYPQTVSGVTVNTDQERYQQWLMNLDDDDACALRMQGHSHVDMPVTPSKVDLDNWELILSQLKREQFYIFMIYNKRLERTVKVYDLKTNTLYDGDDVRVAILAENGDLDDFMKDAKAQVVGDATIAASRGYGGAYGGYGEGFGRYADFLHSYDAKVPEPKETKKNVGATARSNVAQYPGYFRTRGVADDDVDYDALIYGSHRLD